MRKNTQSSYQLQDKGWISVKNYKKNSFLGNKDREWNKILLQMNVAEYVISAMNKFLFRRTNCHSTFYKFEIQLVCCLIADLNFKGRQRRSEA